MSPWLPIDRAEGKKGNASMKTRAQTFFVAVVVACCLFSTAWADDVVPPPWRGDANTTFQEWEFLTNDNPAAPLAGNLSNPYGSPSAAITVGTLGSGWWATYPPIAGGREGVWDIGQGDGQIVLTIPNSADTGPLTWKEVLVQIAYYKDLTGAPTIDVPGASLSDSGSQLVETVPSWGQWWVDWSLWRIEPNPLEETIIISGNDPNMSMIDQIVVDTQSVPEPASFLLMAFGGVSFLFRRRKSA